MFGIGAGEFIVILIVGLIVFGPSKLPEVGRAIGKGLREFRKAQAALSATLNEPLESEKKSSSAEKISEEKNTTTPTVTADDVINLAKEKPLVKESHHEKVFNDNPNNAAANDAGASNAGTSSSSNGTDKQSKPAAN
ncbi:MAG: twin-arginine translocase TatA/TatE family subunit [Selenomonadaceae bacterium]|nr:twin-arginine translocase TatA/TatE family subunit [Selenomonadaceae bacterium]